MTNEADKTTAKAKAEATFEDALLNCSFAPLIELAINLAGRVKAAKSRPISVAPPRFSMVPANGSLRRSRGDGHTG